MFSDSFQVINIKMASALPHFDKFVVHVDEHTAGTRWKKYIARFELLVTAMSLEDEPKRKKALLLHYAGEDVYDIFDTLTAEQKGEETEEGYQTLKQSLTDHFEPKKNIEYETFKFRQARQEPNETVDTFCTRLRLLAASCEFGDNNREIKAQILQGCTSTRLRRRALRDEMTLDKLLETARSLELSDIQAKAMEAEHEVKVNFVKSKGKKSYQNKDARNFSDKSHKSKACGWCGGDARHSKQDCPAKDRKCNICSKMGHYGKVCRSKSSQPKAKVMQVGVEGKAADSDSGDEYVFGVGSKSATPQVDVKINGQRVFCFVDTGASVNIIDKKTFDILCKSGCGLELEKTNVKIFAYGSNSALPVSGTFKADVTCGDVTVSTVFFVVESTQGLRGGNLLSSDTAQRLKLVQFAFAAHSTASIAEICDKHPQVFTGMGKMTGVKVKFHVDPDVKPVVQPHRRIPFHMRKRVEEEIKRLEELDIIEKVDGPTPWVSPIVAMPKPKKPEEIRICVDMRLPNQAIKRTRHVMPTLDDILMRLNGAKVFSKLDLNSGYHQLELDESSRNITAFSTHIGLRRYKRLNFGVTCAAELFQNHIAEAIAGVPNALNTSDDIMVYGRDQEEHDRALEGVLQALTSRNLTLNKSKCEFNKESIEFYGFVFGKDGISPDAKKIEAVQKMETPTSAKEVRSFLGLTNYVARFIPQYATVTKPLRDLTKKNKQWTWETEHEDSFKKLKDLLAKSTTMSYFNPRGKTEVVVDASPFGLGAILTQQVGSQNHVVAFASRALTDVESRYSQTEREALAVVWACEYFHLYLFGQAFTVVSDHKPLEGIFNRPTSQTNARIERWNMRLQTYDFVLKYRPGADNPADFLSRHPVASSNSRTAHERTIAEEYVNFLIDHATPKAVTCREISTTTAGDPTLQAVVKALKSDQWHLPKDSSVDVSSFLVFKTVRNELSFCDESHIILRGSRIVIPQLLQPKVIDIAHEGHQGLIKTKKLLREKVWFPNIDRMVEAKISACLACAATSSEKAQEPLRMTELPESPWAEVSVDFQGPYPSGDYLLVVIDDYSRYPEVEIVSSTSAKSTLPKLHAVFARHGVPSVVKTDNGPPFNSTDFSNFAKYLGFTHRKVTPLWPQANGGVERFMRTLKKVIQTAHIEGKSWKQELFRALLNYRATPHSTTGISPAEALFNRNIRTRLPEPDVASPDIDSEIRLNDSERKGQMKAYADSKRNTKLSELQVGDSVLVKQPITSKLTTPYSPEPLQITQKKGTMVTARNSRRSITRNSSFFKRIPYKVQDHEPPVAEPDLDEPTVATTPCVAEPSGEATPTRPGPATSSSTTVVQSEALTPPAAGSQSSQPAAEPIRRSTRVKKPPEKFKDYEL